MSERLGLSRRVALAFIAILGALAVAAATVVAQQGHWTVAIACLGLYAFLMMLTVLISGTPKGVYARANLR